MSAAAFPQLPQARIEQNGRTRWFWLIPIAAAVLALGLIGMYVVKRGPIVTVIISHGHGLKAGDAVRARGITIGQVEQVTLTSGLDAVQVRVRLEPSARHIARSGSRFWVVRPRLTLTGVTGLETVAGARYLAVIPGHGPPRHHFVALDEPPVLEHLEPDGLEITLVADRRGSLQPDTPVVYRQVVIGTLLSVGLSHDAAGVEARAYIRPAYTNLVRDNSRFWDAGGVGFEAGLRGLRWDAESIQALLEGSVGIATPDNPGRPVRTGHRFTLADRARDEWLAWRPALAVGADLLPAGAARPDMQRITLTARRTGILRRPREVKGWALPVAEGLIAPADMLQREAAGPLEVAGRLIELHAEGGEAATVRVLGGGRLALATVALPDARPWPAQRMSAMEEPADCAIVADPTAPPIFLSAMRLERDGEEWLIDPAVSFDPALHGAAVLHQDSGQLIGLLLTSGGPARIAPIAAGNPSAPFTPEPTR